MSYITHRNTSGGAKPIGSGLFGTCSSTASTIAKVVTLADFDVLTEGVTVHVYFSYSNTASSPTLKVGSTDSKAIRFNGTNGGSWEGGSVISFTYHNGYWIQNDIGDPNTNSYGLSISGDTLSIVSNGGSSSVTLPSGTIVTSTGTVNGHSYYQETFGTTKKTYIKVTGTSAIGYEATGGYRSELKALDISGLGYTTIRNIQMTSVYEFYGASTHIYSYTASAINWYFAASVSVTSRSYEVFLEIVGE